MIGENDLRVYLDKWDKKYWATYKVLDILQKVFYRSVCHTCLLALMFWTCVTASWLQLLQSSSISTNMQTIGADKGPSLPLRMQFKVFYAGMQIKPSKRSVCGDV